MGKLPVCRQRLNETKKSKVPIFESIAYSTFIFSDILVIKLLRGKCKYHIEVETQ